jgi:hypothetical protein
MSIKPSSIVATCIAVLIGFYFVGEINKYNENANRPSSLKEAADEAVRMEKRSRGIAEDPAEEHRRLTAISREARKAKFNPQRSFFDIVQDQGYSSLNRVLSVLRKALCLSHIFRTVTAI